MSPSTAACVLTGVPAFASDSAVHADPVAAVALWLVVILFAGKIGGDLAVRIDQPAVLGELVVGVCLGSLALAGFSGVKPTGSSSATNAAERQRR